MSQYNVEHSCGHTHTYRLFGPHKDRDRKRSWLEGQPCYRCRRAEEGPVARVKILTEYPPSADISITNSFEIKDTLKSRGYRFVREAVVLSESSDLIKVMTCRPSPAWVITFHGDTDYVSPKLESELEWLQQQGIPIVLRKGLTAILDCVVEGRPDLMNAAPSRDRNSYPVRFGPLVSRLLGYDYKTRQSNPADAGDNGDL